MCVSHFGVLEDIGRCFCRVTLLFSLWIGRLDQPLGGVIEGRHFREVPCGRVQSRVSPDGQVPLCYDVTALSRNRSADDSESQRRLRDGRVSGSSREMR